MIAAIGLILTWSRSSTNVLYCFLPFNCIVGRHLTEWLSIMSFEWNHRRSWFSSSNRLPMPSVTLISAFTCVANNFWAASAYSWWFLWLVLSHFPILDDSNSDMTRASSGPATAQRKRASASYVNLMTPHSFFITPSGWMLFRSHVSHKNWHPPWIMDASETEEPRCPFSQCVFVQIKVTST